MWNNNSQFFYFQEGFLSFKFFCKPYTGQEEETTLQRFEKYNWNMSIKTKTKTTQQTAKSHDTPGKHK